MNTEIKQIVDDGGSNFVGDFEAVQKYAKENNLRIVLPEPDELLIDIDTKEDFEVFSEHIKILNEKFVTTVRIIPSRRKADGKHIYVKLMHKAGGITLSNYQRIALQAALGSDRKRDLLSFCQEFNGDPHPIILFEKQ